MSKRALTVALVLGLMWPLSAGPSALDPEITEKIRHQESTASELMRTLHFLTDVYGPRLTGSPNARQAAEWARKTMTAWGLSNAHLETWDFGHQGWTNERVTAFVVSPVKDQLVVEVLAWTPGTNGVVTAPAFQLLVPDRPTDAELSAYLDSIRSQVKGRIILAGKTATVPVNLTPGAARRDEERLRQRYAPDARPPAAPVRSEEQKQATGPKPLTRVEISQRIDEFLIANGVPVRINDAGRELGQIVAFHNATFDPSKVVSTLVMRNEDYGRLSRILADGTQVDLEINIVNQFHPDGRTAYNVVAEIEGTDKKAEVVILGGHLDSWQAATGATDNAVGCATVMEAARILKVIGVRPRRTIRVALWTGEEQGLLGSQAYVKEHFGSFESPKPDYFLLSAYLNIDNGTGRTRGASVFGPATAAAVIREALAPLVDLGLVGAAATSRRALGSTDSASFNAAGLPGINFEQDPIQYESATHHTNLDTFERIIEEDVKTSAIAIAATAYHLAMRDELLPRFDKTTMPALAGSSR